MDRDAAAQLLARLHDAQNRLYRGGDELPVRRLLAESIAWHVPGENLIAGTYRGHDEVIGYMRRRRNLAGATMRMHALELLVGDGDHLAGRTDGVATINGVEHHWSTLGLYRVQDGLIGECWLLPLDPAAFDRVWSATRSRRRSSSVSAARGPA